MKGTIKLLFTLTLLTNSFVCLANEHNKIAVIDIQHILDSSLALKDLKNKLELVSRNLRDQFSKQQQELKKEEEKLLDKKGKVSPDIDKQNSIKFENKVMDAKKQTQKQRAKVEKAYSEGIMQVNNIIVQIVEDLCQIKGCQIVLPTSQLLYASPNLNITKEVLEKLNDTISNINLEF